MKHSILSNWCFHKKNSTRTQINALQFGLVWFLTCMCMCEFIRSGGRMHIHMSWRPEANAGSDIGSLTELETHQGAERPSHGGPSPAQAVSLYKRASGQHLFPPLLTTRSPGHRCLGERALTCSGLLSHMHRFMF